MQKIKVPIVSLANSSQVPEIERVPKEELQEAVREVEIATTNKLAPLFHKKATIVQGELVKDYPLSVKTHIMPWQEGTGDPSPENVRPIHGWNELKLEHCGKNLLQIPDIAASSVQFKSYDCFISENVTVSMKKSPDLTIQKPIWRMSFTRKDGSIQYAIDERMPTKITATPDNPIVSIGVRDTYIESGKYHDIQIELGSTATSYEPYHGNSFFQQFPEEIFGGVYDWENGIMRPNTVVTRFSHDLTHVNLKNDTFVSAYVGKPSLALVPNLNSMCNIAKITNWAGAKTPVNSIWIATSVVGIISTWEYLGLQQDATDSEIISALNQIWNKAIYTVATDSIPIVKLPHESEILANKGITTFYSNTGDTEVVSRSDPHTIVSKISERISILENKLVNS